MGCIGAAASAAEEAAIAAATAAAAAVPVEGGVLAVRDLGDEDGDEEVKLTGPIVKAGGIPPENMIVRPQPVGDIRYKGLTPGTEE